jgi:phosphohistidine phosphatase
MLPLNVLLMRHGDAVDEAPSLGDRGRWLTAKGRARTRHVAGLLLERPEKPTAIWTSPLVRAVQTADIVADVLGYTDEVCAMAELVVDGHPRAVAQTLREYEGAHETILLVGHEPSLSVLANELLGGHEWGGFKKSGLLGLALGPQRTHAKRRFSLEP